MSDQDLNSARRQIDALDDEIVERISHRARLALETARAKSADGSFYDPAREAQVLRRIRETNPGPLTDDEMVRLFREIMSACLALERPTQVVYLGPEGTFTHQAAQRHFGHSAQFTPHDHVGEVFREVESDESEYGVVPVENSTDGVVAHTLDLFIESALKIAGEVELSIHHHLLATHEDLDALRCVRAHPQALAQCRQWLDRKLPKLDRIADSSNAAAALYAQQNPEVAAIAARAAAEQYELNILATNIEDNPDNRTRFLVIGKNESPPSGADKTSVLVSARNRPGALMELLRPLSEAGIDLSRIESRPAKTVNWEYVFFLDLQGHQAEAPIAAALDALTEASAFCKILGSYPCAAAP